MIGVIMRERSTPTKLKIYENWLLKSYVPINEWQCVCVCVTLEWNNKKQKEHMLEISWKHYLSAYEMKYLHNLIKPQEYAKNDKFSNENIWMNHECIFGKNGKNLWPVWVEEDIQNRESRNNNNSMCPDSTSICSSSKLCTSQWKS